MVIIEGDRLRIADSGLVKYITIFDNCGQCLFKREQLIKGYLDFSFLGKEAFLIVVNLELYSTYSVVINKE